MSKKAPGLMEWLSIADRDFGPFSRDGGRGMGRGAARVRGVHHLEDRGRRCARWRGITSAVTVAMLALLVMQVSYIDLFACFPTWRPRIIIGCAIFISLGYTGATLLLLRHFMGFGAKRGGGG